MIKKMLVMILLIIISFSPLLATDYESLLAEASEMITALQEDKAALQVEIEDKNALINLLEKQIEQDQIEINDLRKLLADTANQVTDTTYFSAGLGITYPIGAALYLTVDIPFISLGGIFSLSLNKDLLLQTSLGIRYKF